MNYTILILFTTTPQWLALSREQRGVFFEEQVMPLIGKYEDRLQVRMFDAEAFHARISDFIIVETSDLQAYYYFIEGLRDTALFTNPYLELRDIVMGLENGFKEYEKNP